ncbi:MAG TPA: hypothetical protein DEG17_25240 [Cyanobacteria bacterium UBA11149]|nr:hypothetical protein [Cyanobacteria bacterium UBA11367]HBE60907.1 hypothetical protein [Cyanobacteria bacterium UBA11366]HBK62883.1 hypothetical protein [Cyanobacteria bacterium UBA11166]HBR76615.1 hypothetical protein [Cyanobacteria bacterium UBA11159]HBS72376.1 hypothetical protein [Cyanobacteria bacterium UBA11153]HBW92083.1 hypothetical protein [Cyanobacteria bacterium UBA11149]HCA97061.1 hypothetical protein [Cyanobacteria bacterium UBA9226]
MYSYSERLDELDKILSRYRKQVSGKELALTTTPSEEKERIKLQISDLKAEMQPFEQEYWDIISQQSSYMEISEQEAEVIVAEIVKDVDKIQVNSSTYSDEVIQLLREIRDKVNQSDKSAAAKLKGVISSIPPFVGISYEAELDTENFLRKHLPTFTNFIEAMKKKRLS